MDRPIKIVFVTIPEKGHINPLIGIAQHLSQHHNVEISFFSQVDISMQLKRAGLDCKCVTAGGTGFLPPKEHATRGKEFAERSKDTAWLRRWMKRLLLEIVPSQIGPLHAQVKAWQPDVIVADPMVYSAVIVAQMENIPWAGISSSLNPVTPDEWHCELVDTVKELGQEREKLFARYGIVLKYKVCDVISPWLNTVFTTEEYITRDVSHNDFSFYVGPSIPKKLRGDEVEFPFAKLRKDCKIVYMSLGSQNFYHPKLFQTVSHALRDENIQLVLSMSDLYDEAFADNLPEHVIAVSYTPQLEVLKHVDVMISHGGANSVMECLYNSVPMALLPLCNDQLLQAKFIANSGAGIVLDSVHPDIEQYKKQLIPLLDKESAVRKRAEAIGRSYKQNDGAKTASDLILSLAKNKKPMKPGM